MGDASANVAVSGGTVDNEATADDPHAAGYAWGIVGTDLEQQALDLLDTSPPQAVTMPPSAAQTAPPTQISVAPPTGASQVCPTPPLAPPSVARLQATPPRSTFSIPPKTPKTAAEGRSAGGVSDKAVDDKPQSNQPEGTNG